MRNALKTLAIGLVAAATLLITPLYAADKGGKVYQAPLQEEFAPSRPWTAFYASLGVATGALTSDFGFGVDGWGINGRVGGDAQIGDHVLVGVLVDAQYDHVNVGGGSLSAKEYGAAVRAGFLPAKNVLLYGLVGVKKLDVAGMDTKGLWTGGGLEVLLTKHWRARLEYGHVTYDDIPAAREQTVGAALVFAFPVK